MIERLVYAGMDCARLNFSHGTHTEHLKVITLVRKASKKLRNQITIIQDLPGPKIRVGKLKDNLLHLKKGSVVTFTSEEHVDGSNGRIPITYPNLGRYVPRGAAVFLADGSIRLRVINSKDDEIRCVCETGGELMSEKGVNIPQLGHDFETFTDADKQHLSFGLDHGVDMVAVSFVRKARDIEKVKDFSSRNRSENRPSIIAKIEKKEAVDNIEEIVDASDAVMVARGDLGVENPIEEVPIIQKSVISASKRKAKPVITATQMLESMVLNSAPTRAEVTDIANAIFDGTDAVMLSEETAMGKFPIECVRVLNRVALVTEEKMLSDPRRNGDVSNHTSLRDPGDSLSEASFQISQQLNATLVAAPSALGTIAAKISRFRPKAPIIALTDSERKLRQLRLVWGAFPRLIESTKSLNQLLDVSVGALVKDNLVRRGDRLVIVCDNIELSKETGGLLFVVEARNRKTM